MSRQTRASLSTLFALLAIVVAVPLIGAQDASLTISVKGSTPFANPTPVALKTALLVVAPMWEDIATKTEVGGREASGQMLLVSDLTVVLSTQPMDCTTVFARKPSATETDVTIVAGKTEAYLPGKGWQTTTVGKVFMASEMSTVNLVLDRFSADVHTAALKKKTVSKDGLRGNDGKLVLDHEAGKWRVDFAAKIDDAVVEAKGPLTACPVASRQKSAGLPLLSERRILDAARNF